MNYNPHCNLPTNLRTNALTMLDITVEIGDETSRSLHELTNSLKTCMERSATAERLFRSNSNIDSSPSILGGHHRIYEYFSNKGETMLVRIRY